MGASRIAIDVEPTGAVISNIRRFAISFVRDHIAAGELPDRVGLTVHELLENVAKYSDRSKESQIVMTFVPDGEVIRIQIATKNRVTAQRLADVEARFAELATAPSPSAYYQTLLERTGTAPIDVSGLGLGRIVCEAEMSLRYQVSPGTDLLEMIAETTIPMEGGT